MKYLKKNKNILIFLGIILVMGIIAGIIFGLKQSNDIKLQIKYGFTNLKDILINTKVNNIFSHLSWIIILSILSLGLIFYLIPLAYLFFLGMSLGFNAYTLSISFGLKGLAFSFIYNIIFNLLFIIFLIFILIKLFYIGKLTLGYLIYRKIEIVKYIKRNYLAITIITILVLTNDIFLHFFSTNILKMLTNML